MKLAVIKEFVDKYTKEPYRINDNFLTDDQDRADKLVELGYLEKIEEQMPSSSKLPVDLNGNVETVKDSITSDLEKEILEAILKSEQDGKNRKTVIEHIESLLV